MWSDALPIRPFIRHARRGIGCRVPGERLGVGKRAVVGRGDEAITAFTQAIGLNPKCADAYCNRGDARREKDELEMAIADYSEAIRLNPGHALAYCGRGLATMHGEFDVDQEISGFTQAIRLDPRLSQAYRARGDVYWGILDGAYTDEGESDSAIADYTAAIRIDPRDAEAHCSRALIYWMIGKNEKAIADYSAAIQLDPLNLGEVYSKRGLAYASKGEYDKAIADYTEAIRINSKDAAAYINRGAAYLDRGAVYRAMGEHDRAIIDFAEAIRLSPEDLHSYYARGVAYQNKHEYGRAIADYTEAIRLDGSGKGLYRFSETVTTYNNLAWLLAICPHAEYRDGRRAVEYATHACELCGGVSTGMHAYCLGTLAAAYAEAGEFAQAIHWQTKAIEIETPDYIEIETPDYDMPAAESLLEFYKAGKPYREESE